MDDLLREFVTETNESLDVVDVELVRFEQDPNNAKILDNVFRLVHTIKGTCGFLGLPRLEALAHAAETLMGKFRDGVPATNEAVTLILATIDRIKEILESLEREQREPEGTDDDLISDLERMVERVAPAKRRGDVDSTRSERWRRRCWNGRCGRARIRSMNSSAFSVKPGRAARYEARQAAPAEAAPRTTTAAKSRQSIDPRHRRYARTSDDDGVGTGADAQSVA